MKKSKVGQPPTTITVEQAARYLAVTNMALGSHLERKRVPGTTRFYRFTAKFGWSPADGKEIDDGFTSIKHSADSDVLYEGLESEFRFFRSALRKRKSEYAKTAFDPMNLTVA